MTLDRAVPLSQLLAGLQDAGEKATPGSWKADDYQPTARGAPVYAVDVDTTGPVYFEATDA